MTEQQQQQQQQQQPSLHSNDYQPCESPDQQLSNAAELQQQSNAADYQPCESPNAQQSIAQQPSESSSIATQHFSIAQPTESFDIGSADSECNESQPDVSDADADDAFWWNELRSDDAEGMQLAGDMRHDSPSDDGGGPAKRHRPG